MHQKRQNYAIIGGITEWIPFAAVFKYTNYFSLNISLQILKPELKYVNCLVITA
jgi:hypothetical protein